MIIHGKYNLNLEPCLRCSLLMPANANTKPASMNVGDVVAGQRYSTAHGGLHGVLLMVLGACVDWSLLVGVPATAIHGDLVLSEDTDRNVHVVVNNVTALGL